MLQRVVNAFPWGSMRGLSQNKGAVEEICSLLQQVGPEDVRPSTALPNKAVFHRLVAENGLLNVALFELGAGANLPPHNHPNMMVFSKVIAGQIQAVTFTRTRVGSGLFVKCERNIVLKAGEVHVTYPQAENIHTFRALTPQGSEAPAVVLDFIAPPYNEKRPPTYFAIRPRSELLQSRLPSSLELPKEYRASELPWTASPGTDYSLHVLPDGPLHFETFDRPYLGAPVSLPSPSAADVTWAAGQMPTSGNVHEQGAVSGHTSAGALA